MTIAVAAVRRVLICEDSATYAAGLTRMLARDPEIQVVGVCSTAEETLAQLDETRPHIVTMDLELPGMSGGRAIEQIMSRHPVPILVLAGGVKRGSETVVASLGAGALEVLSKDDLNLRDPGGTDAGAFRTRVKLLSRIPVLHHPRGGLTGGGASHTAAVVARSASVIGICASAGGPQALETALSGLPASFPVPILVVQHISAGFGGGFAKWLDDQVPLRVQLACPGPVAAGIWIAPEGAHLTLDGARLVLDERELGEPHQPSADVLLRSIATSAGAAGVAAVLTGMGRDGAAGLGAVRRAGGLTIAQDEASSAVFGMPRAAAEQGAELILGLDRIGPRLRALRPVGRAA